MQEKKVRIPAISCPHCVRTITRELMDIEGVESVNADPVTRTAIIRWDSPATWGTIRRTLADIGYPPEE